MARGTSGAAVRDLETLLRSGAVGTLSDAQLLERFLASRGEDAEDAFAAVVERHGPMVLAVCRRILRDPDAAEDAFQASFLVLARKAHSIARRELLANWLYGVAVRTARELAAAKARRLARERQVNPMTRQESAADESLDELLAALDLELSRLPDSFRGPVVLCDLQGKTHHEAARILGLPVGTVSSRLVRAREKLRKRLVRRGLNLSAGAVATVCAHNAAEAAISPALVAATSRAAVEFVSGGATAAAIPATLASLAETVSKSLLIGKLTATGTLLTMALVLAASIGAAGVGVARLSQQEPPGPFQRAVADDWSWVDQLPNADPATRDRLERCARSALRNYAALHRLVYDFNLTNEEFINDGKNNFTFMTATWNGKLYWNEGAVRYDYEGLDPAPKPDAKGQLVPGEKGTYSVLRTRDMAAQIKDHPFYGVVLEVGPPPGSLEDFQRSLQPLKQLDPWVHYASCFRPEPMTLKDFWSGCRVIESKEEGHTIVLNYHYAKNPGWMEVTCDKAFDNLPVRWRYGDVQNGKQLTWGEEANEWKKTDGVWYPAQYVKTSFIGREMRPTKEYDLRVSNLRANTAAKIPAAVFTLSDLPMPEGFGGWDNRTKPPISLIRANGLVRERRMGEPFKSLPAHPLPFPKLTDATVRVEKGDYLALVSEYAAKMRDADGAMMKAKTESEQSTAIENIARLESAYAGRFLALAEKHKGDPVAIDALIAVVTNQFTPRESAQAAEMLIRDHIRSESLIPLYSELGSPHLVFSQAGEKLLRAGLANAPSHQAQARACWRLAEHLKYKARTLRKLMGPYPDPFWLLLAKASGTEVLKDARPGVPESIETEAVFFYTRLAEQYDDVTMGSEPAGEAARREIFKLRDLAIGKPAPEAEGPDVDGKPMKLSDYRGKIVLLTFAGSWDRDRSYPLERALVERMKGRPFALLSVNVDSDKGNLLKSIKHGEVTWRCWWEPQENGLNRQRWKANEIACVYVIDASGIIRGKDIEGKTLDVMVDGLVHDLEQPSSRR